MSNNLKEKVVDMTNLRKFIALGVTMAFAAVSLVAVAQGDLDDLLKELEGASPEKAAEKKAEPEKAAEAEKAEEAVAEAEKPAEGEKAEEAEAEKPAEAEKQEEEKADTLADEAGASATEKAMAEAEKAAAAEEEKEEEEKSEEKVAETEQKSEDEKPAEESAAEEKSAKENETVLQSLDEETADKKSETKSEPAVEEKAESVAEEKSESVAKAPATVIPTGDAELIENIRKTEKLRREALDLQAKREIEEARKEMNAEEYVEAVRHYGLALKLMNDRQSSRDLRKECDQGMAEGLYRAALQENDLGRRDRAVKLLEKAIDMRHPKARRLLERWNAEGDPNANKTDLSDIKHRNNDADYKKSREQIRKYLRRSRQHLAVMELTKALENCEIVLKNDPHNREAIRLREQIQRKRRVVLEQERKATREGLIADVDEKWRPVYAVNAETLSDKSAETVKQQTGEDPERTQEQTIENRMKAMRLPTISFKPPATIIDAIEFFRAASKDYDDPRVPIEKRGFNFVLKTPQGALKAQAQAEEQSDDFSSNGDENAAETTSNGLPPIPTITASDITFYEALKLVCDSVDYKFIVQGPVVMVMHKDMSTAELLSRKYDVLDAFLERMTSASADIKEMRSQGFGSNGNNKKEDAEENQEKDWKAFFEQMGVKWPEGSSIMYIKTLGKLYVRNTRENLAEFEKVLDEMGSQPKLIEIETRFVEVSQEDLNSLGFEWILNSDYSLDFGDRLGKALGLRNSAFGTDSGSQSWTQNIVGNLGMNRSGSYSSQDTSTYDSLSQNGGAASTLTSQRQTAIANSVFSKSGATSMSSSYSKTGELTIPNRSVNGNLVRYDDGNRGLGFNAFGGTDSQYNRGNRFLSDTGNYISGSNNSNNDQFMRVNAFLGAADLSLILHMLSQRSDTDLLSAPKVVTKSGENAVIKVVTEYIYPQDYDVQLQSSSSSSGGSNSSSGQSAVLAIVEPQNFTMREVGVILDVTPTYSEANGGTIDLELKPQVVDEPDWHNYGMRIPFSGNRGSVAAVPDLAGIITAMTESLDALGLMDTLSNEDKTAIGARVVDTSMNSIDSLSNASGDNMAWYDVPMEQPFFHVRSIDSKVSITPGSTVVMGGLITEQRKAMDDKVPFLGDLPIFGRLFRSHAEQTIKRNLLIFVTGRLITPSGRELTLNSETTATEAAEVKPAPKAE